MAYHPKKLLLKGIPEDVYKELLRVQYEQKQKYNKQFSLEQAVYKIIKVSAEKTA